MGRESPPSQWAGAVDAGSDVFWALGPVTYGVVGAQNILVWHWCPESGDNGRWEAWSVSDHTVLAADPLHLEPSLLWPCCGKHGYLRGGTWTDA